MDNTSSLRAVLCEELLRCEQFFRRTLEQFFMNNLRVVNGSTENAQTVRHEELPCCERFRREHLKSSSGRTSTSPPVLAENSKTVLRQERPRGQQFFWRTPEELFVKNLRVVNSSWGERMNSSS